MSFDIRDLVLVCADAPSPDQRAQADVLLSRELLARLNGSSRKFDTSSFPLDANGHGGTYRAGVFAFNLPPAFSNIQALGGGTSGVQAPADPSVYSSVLADVTAQGTALVGQVTDDAGASFFTTRRRSVRSVVAAGAHFPLEFFPTQGVGETEPSDGAFRFNTGSWTIRFQGLVYSFAPATPATVSLSLSGVTRSVVRTLADDPDLTADENDQRRRSTAVAFDVQATASFGSPTVVFVSNASAVDLYAIGTLSVAP